MALSFTLLLIGIFGPLAGMDAAWLPLIVGAVGCAATLGRCAWCAWRSDIEGLPSVGRRPRWRSRLRSRALIAWLHLLQPLARFRGRLRGLSTPQAVEPQHMTRHPWKAPLPTLRDALGAARLAMRAGRERAFWAESWVSPTSLLTELVGVLRAARPPHIVHVDEGWRSDRDVSLAVGRWGWLHVQTVMEEHEQGACLFRTRTRLRPSFMGTLRGATLAVVVAIGTSASMFRYDTALTLLVAAAGVAAIAAWTTWQAIRGVVVVDGAVDHVMRVGGLTEIGVRSTEDRDGHGGLGREPEASNGAGPTPPDSSASAPLTVAPRWQPEHPAARIQREGVPK
jgi:hypothetical protein